MKERLLKRLLRRVSSTLKGHRGSDDQEVRAQEGQEQFAAVYPLYGMEGRPARPDEQGRMRWWYESDSYGYVTTGVKVHRPAFIWEWRNLQSTETTDVESWWEPENHRPPICLYVSESYFGTLGQVETPSAITTQFDQVAQDVVLALRLLKPGWFLDPLLSERIYTVLGNSRQRYMGPYRLTFHDEDIHALDGLIFEPYKLGQLSL